MATHFLLQARARTLSLGDVYRMGEDGAYDLFRKMRWPETDGAPICPKCGSVEAFHISTRRKFKCKACSHACSLTVMPGGFLLLAWDELAATGEDAEHSVGCSQGGTKVPVSIAGQCP